MRYRFGCGAIGLLSTVVVTTAVHAQSAVPELRPKFNADGVMQRPLDLAPPAAQQQQQQQQKPTRRAASPRSERSPRPAAGADRTTTGSAQKTAKPPPAPEIERPAFGRIPLENGSIGLSTETKLKPNAFADGRTTPGFENIQRKDSSYIGFSLSVPTTDKQLIPSLPLPLLSRPD